MGQTKLNSGFGMNYLFSDYGYAAYMHKNTHRYTKK